MRRTHSHRHPPTPTPLLISFYLLTTAIRAASPACTMNQDQNSKPKATPIKARHRRKRVACKTLGVPPPGKRKDLARMTAGGKADFQKGIPRFPSRCESKQVNVPVASSSAITPFEPCADNEVQVIRVVPGPTPSRSDGGDVTVIDDDDDDECEEDDSSS